MRLKEKRVSSENPKGRLSKNWREKELSVLGYSRLYPWSGVIRSEVYERIREVFHMVG